MGLVGGLQLPILRGALRGRRWQTASGGKLLRVLLGSYEPEQTGLFVQHAREGAWMLDVGAHVGYYSLLASILVGDSGRVFAFEPDPRNCAFLRAHVLANRRRNITVTESAVGGEDGWAHFERGTGSGTGHLSDQGAQKVSLVRIDTFLEAQTGGPGPGPLLMKVDVEGAEADVLRGATRTMACHRPVVFLSTHGPQPHQECCHLLTDAGYRLLPILGSDVARASELLCLPDGR